MAATITSVPANHMAVYRPMFLKVQRTDPSPNLVEEVFIADSSDVSTLGNGLEVGDVVLHWTSTVQGPIPVVNGQTIILDADMGPYKGVHTVTNYFTDGSDKYAVIDAQNFGAFTPDAFLGSMRIWLDNYTIHVKVLMYTSPSGTPVEILLEASPDNTGLSTIELGDRIKDYFSHLINPFAEAVSGGGVVQDAHGVTALFYRLHVAEVYDVPGETGVVDPYDGDHDVEVDDVEDNATFKVAVNAIHPYSGTLVDWQTANLEDFVIGSSTSKFLTNAPRSLTLGSADRFRLHMLTELASEYEVAHSLRVFDMTSGSESLVLSTPIIIEITAGFAVAVGPADLAGLITVPAKYRVRIIDVGLNPVSENFDFTVDTKCTENRRSFAWLNKFGGVDNYTFTGREIGQSQTKRAAFMRPYAGSGFDFRQRTYRAEPKRTITVSTAMVRRNVRQWLGDDFTESANVIVKDNALWCPAILLSGEVRSYTTGPDLKPFTVEYTTGTDNLSQQA